jgi:hypothetical protein
MTPIAPLIEAFLDETLARQRGVSRHTRQSYALSFQLLFMFAAKRLRVSPSALALEQLDAGQRGGALLVSVYDLAACDAIDPRRHHRRCLRSHCHHVAPSAASATLRPPPPRPETFIGPIDYVRPSDVEGARAAILELGERTAKHEISVEAHDTLVSGLKVYLADKAAEQQRKLDELEEALRSGGST